MNLRREKEPLEYNCPIILFHYPLQALVAHRLQKKTHVVMGLLSQYSDNQFPFTEVRCRFNNFVIMVIGKLKRWLKNSFHMER